MYVCVCVCVCMCVCVCVCVYTCQSYCCNVMDSILYAYAK